MTVVPTVIPPTGERVEVWLTSYWPNDGPDWCLTWDATAKQCVSPLTSGDPWFPLQGQALACDAEWLGKWVYFPSLDHAWPCLDTGATFVCAGGPCRVGLLTTDDLAPRRYDAYLRDEE